MENHPINCNHSFFETELDTDKALAIKNTMKKCCSCFNIYYIHNIIQAILVDNSVGNSAHYKVMCCSYTVNFMFAYIYIFNL